MAYVLYDLRAADGRSFSPFCWRARMALAHKGIQPELRKVRFTDIAHIGHQARTVPVLLDGDAVIRDSWDIALYLDEKLPDAPRLFPTEGDRRLALFMHQWAVTQLHMPIFKALAADIWDALDPEDQPYFRASREKRLGAPLESVRESQAETIAQLRANLTPLRLLVDKQNFVGGTRPTYADYVAFGALQWARVIGKPQLLEPEDAVSGWFQRCLDLHGGTARREAGRETRRRPMTSLE
jgi:glutathione S-transferase